MPYIKQEAREDLLCCGSPPKNCGELNFILSTIIHNYILTHDLRYATLNEVIGVLECAKLELYRQIVAPYEDVKKKENGSVSKLDKD